MRIERSKKQEAREFFKQKSGEWRSLNTQIHILRSMAHSTHTYYCENEKYFRRSKKRMQQYENAFLIIKKLRSVIFRLGEQQRRISQRMHDRLGVRFSYSPKKKYLEYVAPLSEEEYLFLFECSEGEHRTDFCDSVELLLSLTSDSFKNRLTDTQKKYLKESVQYFSDAVIRLRGKYGQTELNRSAAGLTAPALRLFSRGLSPEARRILRQEAAAS